MIVAREVIEHEGVRRLIIIEGPAPEEQYLFRIVLSEALDKRCRCYVSVRRTVPWLSWSELGLNFFW